MQQESKIDVGEDVGEVVSEQPPIMRDAREEVLEQKIGSLEGLDESQQKAVRLCCDTTLRIAAVTGQAGTGKTTIIKSIHPLLVQAGYSVALAAPTGKAAKRIKEATELPAQTIHRLLRFGMPEEQDEKTGKFIDPSYPAYNSTNPMPYDFVLVDEFMMVNQELYRYLIDGMKPGGRIRAFGDINQLPPIESRDNKPAPPPFIKLLGKDYQHIVLQHIHRQAEGSEILEAADKIRRGLVPRPDGNDFVVLREADPSRGLSKFIDDHRDFDFRSIDNQIISPQRKRAYGTMKLNAMIQQRVWEGGFPDKYCDLPRHPWDAREAAQDHLTVFVGDKVVCNKNFYDLRSADDRMETFSDGSVSYIPPGPEDMIFNGETGIVREINSAGDLIIDLGDREIIFPSEIPFIQEGKIKGYFDPRKDLELAYVLTTHKCQGSEYRVIVYVMHGSMKWMQTRRNLYTAVTRAREKAYILGMSQLLALAVSRKGN